jgi:hypothetical protein
LALLFAAIQAALYDSFDDRTEEAARLLEAALIVRQEAIEVMVQYPVKDSPFRMSRTIDSRHGGRMASKNGASPRK